MQLLNTNALKRLLPLAGLLACLLVTPAVHAQNGFVVGVSSDINITLNDPAVTDLTGGNPDNQMSFVKTSQWRFTNVIAMDFSRPEFLLINDPGSVDIITQLDIVIGDTGFSFGDLPVLPQFASLAGPALPVNDLAFPDGVTASVVNLAGTTVVSGNADANVLRIDFTGLAGGGLAPGEEFTFISQLVSDSPILGGPLPAFDNSVLFGLDDGTLANNAQSIVTFLDPTTGQTTEVTDVFDDFGFGLQAFEGHTNIQRFFLPSFAAVETTDVIPEPAACVQATILALLAMGRRRSRRS